MATQVRPGSGAANSSIESIVDEVIQSRIKQLRRYVWVFFAGFVLLAAAGIGFKQIIVTPLIRWAYPASMIVDDIAKLSGNDALPSNVLGYLHEHVESGYSKSMIFGPKWSSQDNYVLFYADAAQTVEVTIKPHSRDTGFKYSATVDNRPIDAKTDHALDIFDPVANLDISDKLQYGVFSESQGRNLHLLRITPLAPATQVIVINCVVLVKPTLPKVH